MDEVIETTNEAAEDVNVFIQYMSRIIFRI